MLTHLQSLFVGGERVLLHNIKILCGKRGISLNDLEELAGIGKNTIYRWNEKSPGIDKVMKVAKVLGVTIEELLEGEIA